VCLTKGNELNSHGVKPELESNLKSLYGLYDSIIEPLLPLFLPYLLSLYFYLSYTQSPYSF